MKIYLETYGCTANKSDESIITGLLKKHHYHIVNKIDEADTIILNTCTVLSATEQRMLSRLRVFKKTKRPIIVTGCMASSQQKLIHSITPDAVLLPPRNTHHIIDLLQKNKPVFTDTKKSQMPKLFEGITAPISIAEGCMFSCSYCITTIARGKLKSYPTNEIINDIQRALNQGCKEIFLTAQDTASYGFDTKTNLGSLLKKITTLGENFRLRVGMMNPYTLKQNYKSILNSYNHPSIYKFLHLPVQSGDNDILTKMNRKYTISEFSNIVQKFRSTYPDITLATDIIVGFPSETEEQFKNTISLIETIQPDITNITRFSARPYTKAKVMKNRIPTDITKQRSRKITQLCATISQNINKKHIGKKYRILTVEKGKQNTTVGRADNYKPIVIKDLLPIGKFFQVEVTDATETHIVGNLI